jgi:2-hydroxy-4-carboxymuconate semialdehyde hemiacetal dehydrogenase
MDAVNIALAGPGFFGEKHLDALQRIEGVDVAAIVDTDIDKARTAAEKYGVRRALGDLEDALAMPQIDAVILCTPTPVHAAQAMQCMRAGKHVEVEIPVADSLQDAEAVSRIQLETGMICMVGHTRRYNPSHCWIHQRILAGELHIQQMDVQTLFFRRENKNAKGEPRPWADHLLWHHAAHTVDLFQYQTGEKVTVVHAIEGPHDPQLGIAMDMSIQLQTESGSILTLALSFNNDGPFGTTFRYICDNGTYVARFDDLVDGYDNAIDLSAVDVSLSGVELQDRDFIDAILTQREPRSSVGRVLDCYRPLDLVERQFGA